MRKMVVLDLEVVVIPPSDANLWTAAFPGRCLTTVSIGDKETLGQRILLGGVGVSGHDRNMAVEAGCGPTIYLKYNSFQFPAG